MSGGYLALSDRGKLFRGLNKLLRVQKKGKHKGENTGLSVPADILERYVTHEQMDVAPAREEGEKRPRKKNPYFEFSKEYMANNPREEKETQQEYVKRIAKAYREIHPEAKVAPKKKNEAKGHKSSALVEQLVSEFPPPKKEKKQREKKAKKSRKVKSEIIGDITAQATQQPELAKVVSQVAEAVLKEAEKVEEKKEEEAEIKKSAFEMLLDYGIDAKARNLTENEALATLAWINRAQEGKQRVKRHISKHIKGKYGKGY